MTISSIILRESVESLFAGMDDTTGVDLDASTARFLDALAQEVRADFPGVPVRTAISGQPVPLAETTRLSVDGPLEIREYEDAMAILREEASTLYYAFDRWVVERP